MNKQFLTILVLSCVVSMQPMEPAEDIENGFNPSLIVFKASIDNNTSSAFNDLVIVADKSELRKLAPMLKTYSKDRQIVLNDKIKFSERMGHALGVTGVLGGIGTSALLLSDASSTLAGIIAGISATAFAAGLGGVWLNAMRYSHLHHEHAAQTEIQGLLLEAESETPKKTGLKNE